MKHFDCFLGSTCAPAPTVPPRDVRGFRSRHVLLMVNGVPANSTADGQLDPARIPTVGIREIKISYGSSGVLYGDNALGAGIEITTVDGGPDAMVEVSGGTPELGGITLTRRRQRSSRAASSTRPLAAEAA